MDRPVSRDQAEGEVVDRAAEAAVHQQVTHHLLGAEFKIGAPAVCRVLFRNGPKVVS